MSDDDIVKVWDSLDAEAFDAATIIRFARLIEAEAKRPPGPRHYSMTLETGNLVTTFGPAGKP
jgi:hypothetical protein